MGRDLGGKGREKQKQRVGMRMWGDSQDDFFAKFTIFIDIDNQSISSSDSPADSTSSAN